MTSRADVVSEARAWKDVPYSHQHRNFAVGVDCAGLIIVVARALEIVAPDFDVNGYSRVPDGKSLLELCDRFMTRIPMAELRPGDVLIFAFEHMPAHMGVVGDYKHGGLSIIHAHGTSDGKGRVIEWRLDKGRRGYVPIQGYAMPGVT